MTTHRTSLISRRLALVAAGGLLAALSLGGVAQAVTDTIFRYTTAKTGYFGIDHMAMAPDSNFTADDYSIGWGTGLGANAVHCFNTGVNLPHGATMTQLAVWTTSGAASNPDVSLFRHKLADGTGDTIAFKTISDSSATRKVTGIAIANTAAVVNNRDYTYGFGVCIGSGDTFHAARVAYTYTNAGD